MMSIESYQTASYSLAVYILICLPSAVNSQLYDVNVYHWLDIHTINVHTFNIALTLTYYITIYAFIHIYRPNELVYN